MDSLEATEKRDFNESTLISECRGEKFEAQNSTSYLNDMFNKIISTSAPKFPSSKRERSNVHAKLFFARIIIALRLPQLSQSQLYSQANHFISFILASHC